MIYIKNDTFISEFPDLDVVGSLINDYFSCCDNSKIKSIKNEIQLKLTCPKSHK